MSHRELEHLRVLIANERKDRSARSSPPRARGDRAIGLFLGAEHAFRLAVFVFERPRALVRDDVDPACARVEALHLFCATSLLEAGFCPVKT